MEEKAQEIIRFCNSCYYVGGNDWLKEFCEKKDTEECMLCINFKDKLKEYEEIKDKIRIHLQNYLQLDNVSFLFGTGASLHLGTTSIRRFPKAIEDKINGDDSISDLFKELIKQYQKSEEIRRNKSEIDVPLEDFLNFLLALQYIGEKSKDMGMGKPWKTEQLSTLIITIKQALFTLCDLDDIKENWFTSNPENTEFILEMESYGKYCYHKRFIKSLLQRPLNLRRANIFTTNYDLAFENAFDELGVYYIDGFFGFHKRAFRPESYDYDLYYPGTATEGKVRRTERVIRYFKLHGSITWVNDEASEFNQYGLVEKPIEIIRDKPELTGNLMIYPTSHKKGYTLDFPYSELFRQFATTITQPQSVLFCIGYSFYDEHINDIIKQALAIPSFTLVIVDWDGTVNEEIKKLKNLCDPRIIILEGEYLGDFKIFAKDIMPNFHDIDIREKVVTTLKKLYRREAKEDEE
ncbi:MAG: SIR2 family protein [Veillonellales bacterium]